jgi:uncharacterized protein (DUF924 family)
MTTTEWKQVIDFWFPEGADADLESFAKHMKWCMTGGADEAIIERFSDLTRDAAAGKLDHWAETAEGRLALLVVLDQFSRSVFRGTPEAYAQDQKALELCQEALTNGHYEAIGCPWRQTFMLIAMGHCEGPDTLERLDRLGKLADDIYERAPEPLKPAFDFSREQPREHRKVIERFGRHPHRNEALGRASTPEELAYLAEGNFPHQRKPPQPELAGLV